MEIKKIILYPTNFVFNTRILNCQILIISDVDFVTPLCSQLTYEGLLDDTFGISCGKLLIFSNITFTISFDYCGFIIIRGIPIFVDFVGTGKPRI